MENSLKPILDKIKIETQNNGEKYFFILFNQIPIINNTEYTKEFVKNQPTYSYKNQINKNQYYTLIMVDRDVPSQKERKGIWIHLCIYNILNLRFEDGEIYYPWFAPSPPKNSGQHRYYFILYQQMNKINQKIISKNNEKRFFKNFPSFIQTIPTNLKPIALKSIFVKG